MANHGICLAALAALAGAAQAGEGPKKRLLYGFETQAEVGRLATESARLSRTMQAEQVTQGKAALAVTFPRTTAKTSQWPGFQLADRKRLAGWERFDLLAMDVLSLHDKPVALSFRFDDAATKSYETRAHASKLLRPGRNAVAVPLKALLRENKAAFDIASLRQVSIFLNAPKKDIQLVIDNVRLVQEEVVRIDVPGAHLFDFSADGGMTFAGFVKIGPSVPYSRQRGWGFVSNAGLRGSRSGRPDDLVSDAVFQHDLHYPMRPFTFRLDLPAGRHRVRYVITNPRMRLDSGVTIGEVEQKVVWTAKKAFGRQGIYFGLDEDYHPGKDVWAAQVEPAWPWRSAEVDVGAGPLDVTVTKAALAALVVYPAGAGKQMAPILADVEKRRRGQFEREHFILQLPKPAAPARKPSPAERAAGWVVFYPHVTENVYGSTVPTAADAGKRLALATARGQREPATLAVYPLRDFEKLTVSAGELRGPGGAKIGADRVEVRLVRYFLRPAGAGAWQPEPMQLVRPATPLHRHFTRQFWLTVTVPRQAAPGLYRGELRLDADGARRSVPVELTVRPFELPRTSRAVFAMYYTGPMQDAYIRMFAGEAPLTFAAALDRQLADMKRHGLNAVQLPMPTVLRVDKDLKRFKLGFEKLEVYVEAMKRHGIRRDFACQMNTLNLAERLLRLKYKEFSPEFNTVLKNTVAEIDRWFRQRGFQILFWVVDEPREQALNPWNRNFAGTMRYLELYAKVPGVRTTVTPMGDENFGVDYMPMVARMDVVQTHPWPASAKTMAVARRAGRPVLWLYNAGIDRLSYGFYLWKVDALGRWQWHYQWSDTGYNPFVGFQWAVAYPSPDGPVPTVGYERIAMGIVDYKYVELLENLVARARKAHVDAAAAERVLKDIRAQIPDWPVKGLGDGTDVGTAYTGSLNRKLDAWRAAVAAQVTALTRRLAGP